MSGAQPVHIAVHVSSYQPHANSSVAVDDTGKFVLTSAPAGEIEVSEVAYPQEKFYVKLLEAHGLDLLRNRITLAGILSPSDRKEIDIRLP